MFLREESKGSRSGMIPGFRAKAFSRRRMRRLAHAREETLWHLAKCPRKCPRNNKLDGLDEAAEKVRARYGIEDYSATWHNLLDTIWTLGIGASSPSSLQAAVRATRD